MGQYYFNWDDAAKLYQLLGFNKENVAECRCVNMGENGGLVNREYLTSLPEFIAWANCFNGIGNCFVGRNPRVSVASKEIKHISTVSIDIDPIRPKGQAATVAQTEECLRAGQALLDIYVGGSLCGTGNGSLVIWTTSTPILAEFAAFEHKVRGFQDECAKIVSSFKGVKIDATQDSARLIKLIGTVSVKGGTKATRFLRLSRSKGDGDDVFRRIRSFSTAEPVAKEVLLNKSLSNDRSGNDYALAIHYKQRGLTASDTLEALAHHALGRPDRRDDHVRIIEKVFGSPINSVGGSPGNLDVGVRLHTPKNSLDEYVKGLDSRKDETPELRSGFREFDTATHGIRRGDIYTVAARPSIGKSSYLLNVANALCGAGKRVLLLSTEMSYSAIWDRFISIGTEIDGQKFSTGAFDSSDKQKKEEFLKRFSGYDFHVCDAFTPNIQEVERAIKEVSPDVLLFDHIQHIEGGEDYKALSLFTQQLKRLARTYNLAVVVASQLKRPPTIMDFKTKTVIHGRPSMNDLKGCGKIEEESAFLVLLYDSGTVYQEDAPVIRAELVKNRFGPNVICDLAFFKKCTKFKSLEECNV